MTHAPRFYYGWVQVLLAAVAMTATLPGRTYGLGLIKEPVRASLGIGDVRFSVLNFWAIILGAAVVLPVGRLVDRFGSRIVLAVVAAALAASVWAMSRVDGEKEFFIALTCVRGFGQGALSVVAIAMVGKWFRRRAPLAMGLFAVLLGVGFVVPLELVKAMVVADGWRAAWAAVAYSVLGVAAVGWLFARSTPESMGVRPDEPVEESAPPSPSATLRGALRTPAFWVYTAAGSLYGLAFSAVTLDNELLVRERAVPGEGLEQTILTLLFVCGLLANLAAGALAKRVRMPRLLEWGCFALAAAMLAFPVVESRNAAMGYAALLGASGGIVTVVFFAIYGQAFGRTHLGAIQAAAQVGSVVASAVGPVLLSLCREEWGRTDRFFLACAAAAGVLGLLCLLVTPPAAAGR